MAGKTVKRWITIDGRHIPIYEDGSLGGAAEKMGIKTVEDIKARGGKDMDARDFAKHQLGLQDIKDEFLTKAEEAEVEKRRKSRVVDEYFNKSMEEVLDPTGEELTRQEVEDWINSSKFNDTLIDGEHTPKELGLTRNDFRKQLDNHFASNDNETGQEGGLSDEEMKKYIVDTPIKDDPDYNKKRVERELADEADAYDREHNEGKYSDTHRSKTGPLAHMTDDQVMEAALKGDENSINEMSVRGLSTTKDLQDYKKRRFVNADTTEYEGQAAPKFVPRVEGDGNQVVKIGEQEYHTEPLHGGYDDRHSGDFIEGHTYVPHITDINSDAKSFFVDNDGNIWHDGSQYLRSKAQENNSSVNATASKSVSSKSIKIGDKEVGISKKSTSNIVTTDGPISSKQADIVRNTIGSLKDGEQLVFTHEYDKFTGYNVGGEGRYVKDIGRIYMKNGKYVYEYPSELGQPGTMKKSTFSTPEKAYDATGITRLNGRDISVIVDKQPKSASFKVPYYSHKKDAGISSMATYQIESMIKNIRSGESDSQYTIAELQEELRRRKKG